MRRRLEPKGLDVLRGIDNVAVVLVLAIFLAKHEYHATSESSLVCDPLARTARL